MAEGFKALVISSQERAISSDINRLQKFTHRDMAELLRYWLDVTGNDDLDAGSVIAEPASVETPLRAEIINGLLAKPQAASQNVFIDPGVAMLMAPDAGADESNYKYIRDAGTVVPGALVIAAGAVATRIDVVECRMNPVDFTATESRDVFDPSTGLFTATVVTKERQGRLEYRVRAGVAGAGYPGNVAGWLPLMIASVPLTALTNNDCTFWDVRPLISDRVHAATALTSDVRVRPFWSNITASTSNWDQVRGRILAQHRGRKLGGILRRGSPGADGDLISLADVANQEAGFVAPTGFIHLYLVRYFGLPRWARYSAAPTLLPRSPRGLPILSTTAPTSKGEPSVGIVAPAAFGFAGAASTDAICIGSFALSGAFAAGGRPHADGEWTYLNVSKKAATTGSPNLPTNVGVFAAGNTTYTLVAGVDFPLNAKRLLVHTLTVFTGFGAAGSYINDIYLRPDGVTDGTQVHNSGSVAVQAGQQIVAGVFEVPVLQSNDGVAVTPNLVLFSFFNLTGAPAHSSSNLSVLAYQA